MKTIRFTLREGIAQDDIFERPLGLFGIVEEGPGWLSLMDDDVSVYMGECHGDDRILEAYIELPTDHFES